MKLLLVGALAAVFFLVTVFIFGPRAKVEFKKPNVALGVDLEDYLQVSESRFDDIVEGTAKTIIWKNPKSKQKTEYAIVYLHGFGATLPETRPFADQIAEGIGANLFYTRLRGHGRGRVAFSEAKASEWMEDAYEALAIGRRLGNKVILMGTSTGASLAVWLARCEGGEGIAALILISPNFGPKDPNAKFLIYPWASVFLPKIMGETFSWSSPNKKIMKYYNTEHSIDPLFEMMALVTYVNELDMKHFDVPILTLFSPQDVVVDHGNTVRFLNRLPGASRSETHCIDQSGDPQNHLIVGDIWSPENNDKFREIALRFIETL